MKLEYHKAPRGNFGDDINEWMWNYLLPELNSMGSSDDVLVGVGSILHKNRLSKYSGSISIMGSGYNGGEKLDAVSRERCRFYAVRGPLTQKALELDKNVALLDPGALMADLQPASGQSHQSVLFIPHHKNLFIHSSFSLENAVAEAGLELLSPELPSKDVLKKIAGASLVVTESLHGAIVADAYRVPWVPVKFGPRVTPFKWHDWASSLDVKMEFFDLLPFFNALYRMERRANGALRRNSIFLDWRKHAGRFESFISPLLSRRLRVAAARRPELSAESILSSRKNQLYEAIEMFRKDFSK